MRRLVVVSVLVVALALSPSAFAVGVRGSVLTPEQKPAASREVVVADVGGERPPVFAQTDDRGEFYVDVPAGEYVVTVRRGKVVEGTTSLIVGKRDMAVIVRLGEEKKSRGLNAAITTTTVLVSAALLLALLGASDEDEPPVSPVE